MSQTKKRYTIATLGCRTNQYESSAYASQLEQLGYCEAQKGELADVCIVNTCTVTASADRESRRAVRGLLRQHPHAQVVVTGCWVESAHPVEEGRLRIVANRDKEKLLETLDLGEELPEFAMERFPGHTRAFVKVQDGCNSFCTYCIIPYVRGRSRSRRMEEIVAEVERLLHNGYLEVVLTGINIGDFDGAPAEGETPRRLAELVRILDAMPALRRLRISSIDPDEIDDELASAVLEGRVTCQSMHVVLQAGSNVVLKKMNRKYTKQQFLDAVEKLYVASPDFTITTDVIVGFPGETEADIEEMIEIIRKVRFAKVHVFPYSERPRTRAALYPNKVPPAVIAERKARVAREADEAAAILRNRFVGREMEVLVETAEGGASVGYTDNFLKVFLEGEQLAANQIVRARLEKNGPEGFLGTRVDHAHCN